MRPIKSRTSCSEGTPSASCRISLRRGGGADALYRLCLTLIRTGGGGAHNWAQGKTASGGVQGAGEIEDDAFGKHKSLRSALTAVTPAATWRKRCSADCAPVSRLSQEYFCIFR